MLPMWLKWRIRSVFQPFGALGIMRGRNNEVRLELESRIDSLAK
jgi:hypothetical protein